MGHPGRNRLDGPCCQVDRNDGGTGIRFELEIDRAVVDLEPPPPAIGGSVSAPQGVRQRVLIPGACTSEHNEVLGKLGAIAEWAVDRRSHLAGAPVGVEDPWSWLEGRTVTDVLIVKAGQLRHPIALAVGVEPDDRPDHSSIR